MDLYVRKLFIFTKYVNSELKYRNPNVSLSFISESVDRSQGRGDQPWLSFWSQLSEVNFHYLFHHGWDLTASRLRGQLSGLFKQPLSLNCLLVCSFDCSLSEIRGNKAHLFELVINFLLQSNSQKSPRSTPPAATTLCCWSAPTWC